jgi:RNA polymerase sigma-54 factor
VIWQLEKQPPTIAQQKLIDFFQAVRKDKEFLYYKIDFFNTLEKQYPGIEQQAQRLFQQLELSPAAAFQSLPDVSIVAELLLKKNNGQFYVCLNEEALYDIDITLPEKKDQQHFYQSAQSLKKMVATRYKTLLDVARFLVQAQQEFFTAGPKALKPLQLSDIATALALHESTISRIVQSKYLWAETHFIPLKSLLSRKLKHQDLGAVSTVHVRDCLEKLLRYENPREPLSDQQLQYILSHQGYDLARRTIAKHREILGFKNSRHRKISY